MRKLEHGGDIYSYPGQEIIDFSANINPLGMPASVKKAIVEHMDLYSHYPDPLCRELRSALAKHEQVNMEQIVCGNGAADLIFRLCLALKPQQGLVLAPTFSEYEAALTQAGCHVSHVVLKEAGNFAPDERIGKCINPSLDIVFVCNPNNPTGIPIHKDWMLELAEQCRKTNTLLAVDECFMDFVECPEEYSILPFIHNFENVVVFKAFTKIYAMAGIRLGYCICGNISLAGKIEGMLQPWSVSAVAEKCGIAALAETEYIKRTRVLIKNNRLVLANQLENLGFTVFPSAANYIFFKSGRTTLRQELEAYGILIRSCANYRGLNNNFYRIAIKSADENTHLAECLKIILDGGNTAWQKPL